MKPLRRPRWLPGVSQAAPGRLLGAAKRNPGTSEDSKGVQGPLGTPKNPPRTPQEPPKNPLKTLFGDPCPRRFGAIAHPESV